MAKMKLSEGTFSLIPEGTTVFKIVEVDDSKYEDFGKLSVKMQTAKGETHTERFSLTKANGELNEGALKAWSYFARTCLNNYSADEIDTQDIVGCYIEATVKHEEFESNKEPGKMLKSARLNDYNIATGFAVKSENKASESISDADDLDDFLND